MQSISSAVIQSPSIKADQQNFFGSPSLSIYSLHYDIDRQVLSGLKDGTVRVYDTKNPSKVSYYITSRGQSLPTVSVRWIPKQKRHFLSLSACGVVLICDELLHDLTYIKVSDHEALAMDVNPDTESFAVASKTNKILFFDIATKKQTAMFLPGDPSNNYEGHTNHVYALKYIDENTILSGGWDSTVRLWDIRTCKQERVIHGPNISGDAIDYLNGEVLTASYRNEDQLQLWDMGSGKLQHTFVWDPTDPKKAVYPYCCKFGKGRLAGRVVAGADKVNEAKVFGLQNKQCEVTVRIQGSVFSLDVRDNGFCIGGDAGVGHLIRIK